MGHGNEVQLVPLDMINEEFRGAFVSLARAMKIQLKREVRPRMNSLENTITSRLREFLRMNPLIIIVSKVVEGPLRVFGWCL